MRRSLPILLSSMLLLAACNSDTATLPDDSLPTDDFTSDDSSSDSALTDTGTDSASSVAAAASSADDSGTDSSAAPSADARVIEMAVDDWTFSPAAITAKIGENVVVRLKGVEGVHSFAIPDLGINIAIKPGETHDVVIPTDKAGTFAFRCFIPCGPGHKEMIGQIVVS